MLSQAKNQTEAELGNLINQSGKLRMLSHRAVMFAMLDRITEADAKDLDTTIEEFREIAAKLTRNERKQVLDGEIVAALRAVNAVTEEHETRLATFLRMAAGFTGRGRGEQMQQGGNLSEFASFVANDLLRALNQIVDGIHRALAHVAQARETTEAESRDVIVKTLANVDRISRTVHLISINVAIEAARVGDDGKGFSTIAREIRSLSQETSEAVNTLRFQIESAVR